MTRYAILFLIFLPISLMSQNGGRTPTFNFNVDLTQPEGQFSEQVENPFLGIDINAAIPFGARSPLGLGFNFGWGITSRTDGQLNINGTTQDVKFVNHVYNYSPFLRLKPINAKFNPYIDASIGLRRFLTRYNLIGGGISVKERYGNEQFALAFGWAFGLEIFINRSIFLEMRFEDISGSSINDLFGNEFRTDTRSFGLGIGFRL